MAKYTSKFEAADIDRRLGDVDKKAGLFYYDPTNNRYLVFTNEAARDEYLEDTSKVHLIIGTFDAPFNYSAEITLITPTYNAVFLNSTGNYLDFSFDIKNKQGASTGENVTVTYTFIRNADKKVITETRKYGENVHFNIDEYLLEGTNTITVGIMGQSSLAATTVALTYQVVNLSYTDDMNIANVYNLSKSDAVMEVFFSVSGYGTKIVEWFIDGKQLDFVKNEDEVVDASSQRTKYITLTNLDSGVHNIQSRAYALVNGEKFYTDTLYREFIVDNGDLKKNMVAVAVSIPSQHGIVNADNPLVIYDMEQYISYEIRFATRSSGEVDIYLGEDKLASVASVAGRENVYGINSNKYGSHKLKFVVGEEIREVSAMINKTTLNIEEITNALTFDFRAVGKSNASIDKDQWSYGDYVGTFEGFNWNASSGWVDNALIVNSGASFSINYAPLSDDATLAGKTLEFEFSARNVENDDAVICDLTTMKSLEDGTVRRTGILITASEAKIISYAGVEVSTKFKAGEINRIAFVINKKQGVTYKGLVFVYVNGVLSGAINYGSSDNFISDKQIEFVGSDDAQVVLRAIRIYNNALSADNILNNYILYRDTLLQMMEVYYRNDIYAEGLQNFSPDVMLHRLPVMIMTGDIPTLEGATSTSTQILVDIEYYNEQDPAKSFKMKNAALRIQGTSSLAYPRKNFRFYTKKEESTVLYDAEGNVINDKLYAFKDGAQPVDCWCLKADFAESSGTHNTGIARIWNKVLFNAQIEYKNVLGETHKGYLLRTEAQNKALEAGYNYDVRTTIDGFPIVLFYKRSAEDTNLIFLGKYNFNNDKSTPSVFGFENIPNFNNARMQCWETKDNGHPLGLFTDVSNFDSEWSEAFESRYPDTKTPDTSDLKSFSQWLSGVSQENFIREKWAHLDVFKVAAYYCYLMRFGAVDQPVKNGFLTSEDGVHFYYINYDNDTINGLINTGKLELDPTINRQTIGSDGEYVYAGHSSVMWNRCEADQEFMDIVSIVDNALYSAGLKYDDVINMFNDEQADKWVERVYNQDAEYKYLLPFVNAGINNLFMLQGSRSSHRSWWLSKRFSLYDSLFASGNYRDRNISFKCLNDTPAGQKFTIVAGDAMNYGYGVNNGIRETGVYLEKNEERSFITTDTLNLGDVVKIFAATSIVSVDFSELATRLAVLDCSAASDPVFGTKLKSLILGKYGTANTQLSSISGIGVLTGLQTVNIEGYKGITSLDLKKQTDFRELYAKGSKLASVEFAKGAPVSHLEFPASMLALSLEELPDITWENISMEGGMRVESMRIVACPNLSNNFDFIKEWVESKTQYTASNILEIDGVQWENVNASDFVEFSQCKKNGFPMTLRGYVSLNSMTLEQANVFQDIWGEDCFEQNADFQIIVPDAIYINPDNVTIFEGESVQFDHLLFSSETGTVEYRIVGSGRTGASINRTTGLLTTTENGLADGVIYVRAIYTTEKGQSTYDTATVNVKKRIYPSSSSIVLKGASTISKEETYSWSSTNANVSGVMVVNWSLSGAGFDGGYVSIESANDSSCVVKMHKAAEPNESIYATLTLSLTKEVDGTAVATKSISIKIASYSYPTADDTTVSGNNEISENGDTFTWASTATGFIGEFTAEWSLSENLARYYEITSQEYDAVLLKGSCVVSPIAVVEDYVKGDVILTITRTNSLQSFTVRKTVFRLSGDVVMTDDTNPAVLSCLYNAGLCANSTHMTKAEAEAVTDGQFNPTAVSKGSIFYNKPEITHFDELKHFTGLTRIDAYAFESCNNLESVKIPDTVRIFESRCFYRGYLAVTLHIDHINLTTANSAAFSSYMTHGQVHIGVIDLYEESSGIRYSAFNAARIDRVNVHSMVYRTGTYGNYYFTDAHIGNIVVDENATLAEDGFYDCSTIESIHIPETINTIPDNCFGGTDSLPSSTITSKGIWTKIKFDGPIKSLGSYCLGNAWFEDFIDFSSTDFQYNSPYCVAVHFENGLSMEFRTSSVIPSNYIMGNNDFYCKKFICPRGNAKYKLYRSGTSSVIREIDELYIPNIINFCNSVYGESTASLTQYANKIFVEEETNNQYVELINFDTDRFVINTVSPMLFRDCKPIKKANLSMLTTIPNYLFENSGLTELTIDSYDGNSSIGTMAFSQCKDLISINDTSYAPWKSISIDAFLGINKDATINSNVFGLFTQNTGIVISLNFTMNSGSIYPLTLGEKNFSLPEGVYFEDMTTTKTIRLEKTGRIEDLTEQLIPAFVTLIIESNMPDAEFSVTYVDSVTGEECVTTFVGVGTKLVHAKISTSMTITPITEYEGLIPLSTTVQSVSATNNVECMYEETVNVYIQHVNGSLITVDNWKAGGYTNEEANGVAITSISTNFVLSPTRLWKSKTFSNSTITVPNLTGRGKYDTAEIISKNGGKVHACEYCQTAIFPNGLSGGYMGGRSEYNCITKAYDAVNEALLAIGGNIGSYDKAWSTDVQGNYSWLFDFSTGKFSNQTSMSYSFKAVPLMDIIRFTEYISLDITADDVSGNKTSTTIYYTAKAKGVNVTTGEVLDEIIISGTAQSDTFPQNTSETEEVAVEISYSYMGMTATTTIIQGVYRKSMYIVNLNDQWETSSIANPDSTLYDGVYQSFSNKGVNSTEATMYIDIFGYESFSLYIRSYAESSYDYVMVSQLDIDITNSTPYYETLLVKAHTRDNQKSGTAISNYTLVEFTGIDKGEYRITIVYRKDGSGNYGDDRGYVLIPKNQ